MFEVVLEFVAEPLVSQAYVYLFLVFSAVPELSFPNANIPRVLFPAAVPYPAATLADVVDALVSEAYVYLFLQLSLGDAPPPHPNANIPIVDVPAADPAPAALLEAVAATLVSQA